MSNQKKVEPRTISLCFFFNTKEKKLRAYTHGDKDLEKQIEFEVYKLLHPKYQFKLQDELNGAI